MRNVREREGAAPRNALFRASAAGYPLGVALPWAEHAAWGGRIPSGCLPKPLRHGTRVTDRRASAHRYLRIIGMKRVWVVVITVITFLARLFCSAAAGDSGT